MEDDAPRCAPYRTPPNPRRRRTKGDYSPGVMILAFIAGALLFTGQHSSAGAAIAITALIVVISGVAMWLDRPVRTG